METRQAFSRQETRATAAWDALLTRALAALIAVAVASGILAAVHWARTGRVGLFYEPRLVGRTAPLVAGEAGAPGADFAQVYFAARALEAGANPYEATAEGLSDPFGRRPNYPPLVNELARPLARLPYRTAYLLHLAFEIIVYLAGVALILGRAGLARFVPAVALASALLLVATPIGHVELERGQFDLYAALAVLSFAWAFLDPRPLAFFAMAGALSCLKWSALPIEAGFGVGAMVLCGDRARRPVLALGCALVFALVVLSSVAFWPLFRSWLVSLDVYEFSAEPGGLTFQPLLGAWGARVLPVLASAGLAVGVRGRLGAARAREIWPQLWYPLLIAVAISGVCAGAIVWEHRATLFLALVPALAVWLSREGPTRGRSLSSHWWLKDAGAWGSVAFLVVVTRAGQFGADHRSTPAQVAFLFLGLGAAIAFFGVQAHALSAPSGTRRARLRSVLVGGGLALAGLGIGTLVTAQTLRYLSAHPRQLAESPRAVQWLVKALGAPDRLVTK